MAREHGTTYIRANRVCLGETLCERLAECRRVRDLGREVAEDEHGGVRARDPVDLELGPERVLVEELEARTDRLRIHHQLLLLCCEEAEVSLSRTGLVQQGEMP